MSNQKVSNFALKATKGLLYLGVVMTPLFYLEHGVYPYILSKTAFFQLVIELMVVSWAVLAIFDKSFLPKKTPVITGLLIFIGVLMATSILGVDFNRSFWSTQERSFGVFAFLHLAALTLVISSIYRKISLKFSLYLSMATASLVSIIAFLQLRIPNLLLGESVGDRPGATFGNPTFLAGYVLIHFFIAAYFLIEYFLISKREGRPKVKKAETIFLIFALLINLAALFRTQTRGDILGLIGGIIVLFIVLAIQPLDFRFGFLKKRGFYLAVIGVFLLLGSVFWMTRSSRVWSFVPGVSRFSNTSLSEQSFGPRLIALKIAWKGFLERPIAGWGWENFNIPFNKQYDPKLLESGYQETRFDKPHNYLAEYLVTGGVFLFLSYVVFLGLTFYELRKIKDKLLGKIVLVVVVAYVVRNFFVFETLGPALILFVVLGLVDGVYKRENEDYQDSHSHKNKSVKKEISGLAKSFAVMVVLVGVIGAYLTNFSTIRATNYQYWGFKKFVANNPSSAVENFKKAISIWTPYRFYVKRDYAMTLSENYFYNAPAGLTDEIKRAVAGMEELVAEHPLDAYNHYVLVDIYNQVFDIDPKYYGAEAEKQAAIALELSPNRQEILFSLAKTKTLMGDYKSATEVIEKAIALNPKIPDAHFYYGLILFSQNDLVNGYIEIKKSIELGRKWKVYHEPRVVANYFADGGHFEEAIDLYKEAMRMEPDDVESEIKLGIVYLRIGKIDLAREAILSVSKKVDLKSLSTYEMIKPILDQLGILLP